MILYEGKNWDVVFVDWSQDFPGGCLIASKLKRQSLSELESDEWVELGLIEKELERINKKLFNATMHNFACLMNNAYRDNEIPCVHFWVIPRYKNIESICGKKYKDIHFGYNMWKWALSKFKCQKDIFSKEDKEKIYNMMKNEWSLK